MSRDLNKVQLIGRLGAEPDIKVTPQGNTVVTFRVASSRRWRKADDQMEEETEWFRVVAWNKLGEVCGEYLHKGSRIYIEGRLKTRSWDDQNTGEKRYMTEVIANDMIMLDSKNSGMGGSGDYGDNDVGYADEAEPEQAPVRSAPRRAPAPANGNGGAPSRAPVRASNGGATATAPRRPVAPRVEDDEDLPF